MSDEKHKIQVGKRQENVGGGGRWASHLAASDRPRRPESPVALRARAKLHEAHPRLIPAAVPDILRQKVGAWTQMRIHHRIAVIGSRTARHPHLPSGPALCGKQPGARHEKRSAPDYSDEEDDSAGLCSSRRTSPPRTSIPRPPRPRAMNSGAVQLAT